MKVCPLMKLFCINKSSISGSCVRFERDAGRFSYICWITRKCMCGRKRQIDWWVVRQCGAELVNNKSVKHSPSRWGQMLHKTNRNGICHKIVKQMMLLSCLLSPLFVCVWKSIINGFLITAILLAGLHVDVFRLGTHTQCRRLGILD
jgi:hypothetical protein